MKNNNKIATTLLLATSLCACSPQEDKLDTLVPNTGAEIVKQLNPTATLDPNNSNLVNFSMKDTDGLVGVWKLGEEIYPRNNVSREYDFEGTYQVEAYAYNKHGMTPAYVVEFVVPETNPTLCENMDYFYLAGGCESPEGKTWKLDSGNTGYYGMGPTDGTSPEWWPATPGSHNGVYDDKITFVLSAGMEYIHKTNGTSGIDSEEVAWEDYTATWRIYTDSDTGVKYIQFTGEGFFPPRSTDSIGKHIYRLVTLTEDLLVVSINNNDGTHAWYYRFIPSN